jgi:hypothetical protein
MASSYHFSASATTKRSAERNDAWRQICKAAARRAGISVERAVVILKSEGRTARHHCGIVDANDVLKRATSKRGLRPGRCRWRRDDGGRRGAGDGTHDCVPRAIAIATGKPYREVYEALVAATREYVRKRPRSRVARWIKRSRNGRGFDPAHGVYKKIYRRYVESLGWQFTSTKDRKVRLRADELPTGWLIVEVHRHLVTVIDHVIHDTFDSGGAGRRPVIGYYTAERRWS